MAEIRVVGDDGATWSVRRRWLPWRRPISLREWWRSPAAENTDAADDVEDSAPPGPVLRVLQLTVGLVLWAIIGIGKLALIILAVVLALTIWLVDSAVQLLLLPVVLIARACRIARWPVQVNRDDKFVRTEWAQGYAAAAALRDQLAVELRDGTDVTEAA